MMRAEVMHELEEFDTDKEERQGGWVVLAMFAVLAAGPPIASLWMLDELVSASAASPPRVGPLLGGLAVVGMAAVGLSVVGAALVVYGLVRIQMHGPLYVLAGMLTTVLALSPVLLGWNRVDEIPSAEGFDPGDCSICGDAFDCEHRWPAVGPSITARGTCRDGRRDGEWIFATESEPELAKLSFEAGLRSGAFETPTVRGSFRDDARDGGWEWLRSGEIYARGAYADGRPNGRWVCLDEKTGGESSFVVFDRGRVVEGTGDVYEGDDIVASSEVDGELELDGIACAPPAEAQPIDHFERMVSAEP